jgi:enolase
MRSGRPSGIGWNTGRFKVGLFARFERMVKWNEALRIEPALWINT